MRRRIAALLGIVLASSAPAVVTSTPASATDVCAGLGNAVTGPLYFPVTVRPGSPLVTVRQPNTVGFGLAAGQCVSTDGTLNKQLVANGTLTGWCGHSSGQGVANDGATFAWISAGGMLVVTGHVTGVAFVKPDLLTGSNCLTGATSWTIVFVVLLLHCAVLTSALTVVPVPATLGTVVPDVLAVHTGQMRYHVSVCVPGVL